MTLKSRKNLPFSTLPTSTLEDMSRAQERVWIMPVAMNALRVSMAPKASAHNVPMAPSPGTLARLADFLRRKTISSWFDLISRGCASVYGWFEH